MTISADASRHSTVTAMRALGTSASRSRVLAVHATVTTADNTATIVYRLGTRKFDKKGRCRAIAAGAQELNSPAVNVSIASVVTVRDRPNQRFTSRRSATIHDMLAAVARTKGRPT